MIVKNLNFIPFDKLESPMRAEVKIRYSAKPSGALIEPVSENEVKVSFNTKQRAITKGQSAVFYDKDTVIGGGVIDKIL